MPWRYGKFYKRGIFPERIKFPPKPPPERITWDQRAALEVLERGWLRPEALPEHGLKQRVLHEMVDLGLAHYLPRRRCWQITNLGRTMLEKERAKPR